MLKKIIGISAVAFCTVIASACSTGTGTDSGTVSEAGSNNNSDEEVAHGAVLTLPDILGDMKAKGTKTDLSELVDKYKPLVELAEYKGVKVASGEAYEMTDEEVEYDLDMLLESLKNYDDVTEGGTTQDGDSLTLNAEATLDGQPYEGYSFEEDYYEIGSGYITEDFDKQLTGKKAGEDFEIKVTFPNDYVDEENLEEGEVSLNGKTLVFKTKILSIERAVEEELNDDWVKAHKETLSEYGYGDVNTLDELKTNLKKTSDENRAKSLLEERGSEALGYIIAGSKFSSYPEDELKTLIEQTKSNIQQEYEAYKDMLEVKSLEEYLEMGYDLKGENALEDYATTQAQEYLQNKMAVTLIADSAGIEIGEDDVKKSGEEMALYYGMDSYDSMVAQYGDSVKSSALLEALYSKVILYLGSQSDPSLEPVEEGDYMTEDIITEESETSVAE